MRMRLYRAARFYTSLVWLNVLFLASVLLVVTAPAGLVALVDGGRLIAQGRRDEVTWRRFLAIVRTRLGAALLLIGAAGVVAVGAGLALGALGSAPAQGALAVVLTLCVLAALLAAWALSFTELTASAAWRTGLVLLAARPLEVLCTALIWGFWLAGVLFIPLGMVMPFWAVVFSVPASLSCLVLQRAHAAAFEGGPSSAPVPAHGPGTAR